MINLAIQRARSEGIKQQIEFKEILLPDQGLKTRYPSAPFIFSNSLLHHLPEASTLWDSIYELLDPIGECFIMDLMRPDSKETAREMMETYAADEPEILRTDFYNSLLAAYTVEEVTDQLATARLNDLTVEAVSDRHMIIYGVQSRFIPGCYLTAGEIPGVEYD